MGIDVEDPTLRLVARPWPGAHGALRFAQHPDVVHLAHGIDGVIHLHALAHQAARHLHHVVRVANARARRQTRRFAVEPDFGGRQHLEITAECGLGKGARRRCLGPLRCRRASAPSHQGQADGNDADRNGNFLPHVALGCAPWREATGGGRALGGFESRNTRIVVPAEGADTAYPIVGRGEVPAPRDVVWALDTHVHAHYHAHTKFEDG